MTRRRLVALLAAAAAWSRFGPRAGHAQRAMPVVGFLGAANATEWADLVAAFKAGLAELGYVEGTSCAIDYRWAGGSYDLFPSLALDLVNRNVELIAALGGTRSIQSAKLATRRTPIVFVSGSDPVQLGLVANMQRPDGNLTGITFLDWVHGEKRLDLLRMLVPSVRSVAALFNPSNPITPRGISELSAAGNRQGIRVEAFNGSSPAEIDAAFATIVARRFPGLIVHADPFLLVVRERIVALANRHRLPTVYAMHEFADQGGLVSYGSNVAASYRQAGVYAGRLLKGATLSDLPVQQSTDAELVVNLSAAQAAGIAVPDSIVAMAKRVIR